MEKTVHAPDNHALRLASFEESLSDQQSLRAPGLVSGEQRRAGVPRHVETVVHFLQQLAIEARRATRAVGRGHADQQGDTGARLWGHPVQALVDRRRQQLGELAESLPPLRQTDLRALEKIARFEVHPARLADRADAGAKRRQGGGRVEPERRDHAAAHNRERRH